MSMDKQAFSKITLNQIYKNYFEKGDTKKQLEGQFFDQFEDESIFNRDTISKFSKKNRIVYRINKLNVVTKVIERKIILNLKQIFKFQTVNRTTIVKRLILLLRENVPYTVYRLDIRHFYESFKIEDIKEIISDQIGLSPRTKKLINHLFDFYNLIEGRGCPRGLAISSILTEILMQNFDIEMRNRTNCFFYERYVDDIIIITSKQDEDLIKDIEQLLPKGLLLNKQKTIDLEAPSKKNDNKNLMQKKPNNKCNNENNLSSREPFSFEYLGYKYVLNTPSKDGRTIDIDMSDKKCKRYKFKIFRAFYDFYKKGDLSLLENRIKFLTCNYKITKNNGRTTILAGIYYNYPEISLQNNQNSNLKKLDKLLKAIITNNINNNCRLTKIKSVPLSGKIKKKLLKYSFEQGYKKKIFYRFSSEEISRIKKCWEY